MSQILLRHVASYNNVVFIVAAVLRCCSFMVVFCERYGSSRTFRSRMLLHGLALSDVFSQCLSVFDLRCQSTCFVKQSVSHENRIIYVFVRV